LTDILYYVKVNIEFKEGSGNMIRFKVFIFDIANYFSLYGHHTDSHLF